MKEFLTQNAEVLYYHKTDKNGAQQLRSFANTHELFRELTSQAIGSFWQKQSYSNLLFQLSTSLTPALLKSNNYKGIKGLLLLPTLLSSIVAFSLSSVIFLIPGFNYVLDQLSQKVVVRFLQSIALVESLVDSSMKSLYAEERGTTIQVVDEVLLSVFETLEATLKNSDAPKPSTLKVDSFQTAKYDEDSETSRNIRELLTTIVNVVYTTSKDKKEEVKKYYAQQTGSETSWRSEITDETGKIIVRSVAKKLHEICTNLSEDSSRLYQLLHKTLLITNEALSAPELTKAEAIGKKEGATRKLQQLELKARQVTELIVKTSITALDSTADDKRDTFEQIEAFKTEFGAIEVEMKGQITAISACVHIEDVQEAMKEMHPSINKMERLQVLMKTYEEKLELQNTGISQHAKMDVIACRKKLSKVLQDSQNVHELYRWNVLSSLDAESITSIGRTVTEVQELSNTVCAALYPGTEEQIPFTHQLEALISYKDQAESKRAELLKVIHNDSANCPQSIKTLVYKLESQISTLEAYGTTLRSIKRRYELINKFLIPQSADELKQAQKSHNDELDEVNGETKKAVLRYIASNTPENKELLRGQQRNIIDELAPHLVATNTSNQTLCEEANSLLGDSKTDNFNDVDKYKELHTALQVAIEDSKQRFDSVKQVGIFQVNLIPKGLFDSIAHQFMKFKIGGLLDKSRSFIKQGGDFAGHHLVTSLGLEFFSLRSHVLYKNIV